MIRNEKEYQDAVRRLEEDKAVMKKQREALEKSGLSKDGIKRAMEPAESFHEGFVEEVEWYERVKRGDIATISQLSHIGRILIALRIAGGLTQKDLADKLGVSETQVSRDERNEYHGISVDRAQKIVDLFHAKMQVKLEFDKRYRPPIAKAS